MTIFSNTISPSILEEVQHKIQDHLKDWQSTTINIAIAGMSGSGKSSLINTILNQKVAPVGVIETTMEAKSYDSEHGITFVDLPGCGTTLFPFETYAQKMQLQRFDAIILVTSNRFYEQDAKLYAQITQQLAIPCFVVRSKIDLAINDGLEDNGLSPEQVCESVTENIYHNLAPHHPEKIYLVSNRYRNQYDLNLLINDLCLSLAGLKQTKFRAESAAYSKEAIKQKRSAIEKIAVYYALSAALNGAVNPIPILNLTLDVKILMEMSNHILRFYGLTEAQMAHFVGVKQHKVQIKAFIQSISRWSAQFLTVAGITEILKRLTIQSTTKTIASWVPFVGQMVAAGISYKMTIYFATEMINEAEQKSLELLDMVFEN